MSLTGVIYARLSDVRKGDVEGIERQIREGEAHAERLGVTIVERLVDNDITAADRKKKRPDFQRLMAGMAANEWDYVILRSLERWVRVPMELEEIIEVAAVSTVKVESIHGGKIDLRTRQGRLVARMMTNVAMDEVDAVRERTLDWHADRAARGLPMAGNAGYGFNADKLTVNEDHAVRIKEAAVRVLAGEPLAGITREWNESGVPAPGEMWRPQTLRRILLAPRTAGLRVHRGVVVGEAQWPAILDRITYERVALLLNRPERKTASSRGAKLLTGIASCGKCEKTLNSKVMHGARRYQCRHCYGTSVYADRLDGHVVADLLTIVDQPALDAATDDRDRVDVDAVMVQIGLLKSDRDELAECVGDGRMTVAEWKIASSALSARLGVLSDQLRQSQGTDARVEWRGRGAELAASWDGWEVGEQRRVLLAWIEDVRVNAAIKGRNRFDKARVKIAWRA